MIVHRKKMSRKKRRPLVQLLITMSLLAIGGSALQYLVKGRVDWPSALKTEVSDTLQSYPTRSSASWRQAAEQIEGLGGRGAGEAPSNFDFQGRVVKIIDGDSLSLLASDKRQHTVRLYGIDTPEWDQPHGGKAKIALAELVSNREVGIVMVETDTFGRVVGTVYLEDQDINLTMVQQGHAWWFTRYAPYERHLAEAEETARERRAGLWAQESPVAPWHWRRTRR